MLCYIILPLRFSMSRHILFHNTTCVLRRFLQCHLNSFGWDVLYGALWWWFIVEYDMFVNWFSRVEFVVASRHYFWIISWFLRLQLYLWSINFRHMFFLLGWVPHIVVDILLIWLIFWLMLSSCHYYLFNNLGSCSVVILVLLLSALFYWSYWSAYLHGTLLFCFIIVITRLLYPFLTCC